MFLPLWATRKAHPGIETSNFLCLFIKHLARLCTWKSSRVVRLKSTYFSWSDLTEKKRSHGGYEALPDSRYPALDKGNLGNASSLLLSSPFFQQIKPFYPLGMQHRQIASVIVCL